MRKTKAPASTGGTCTILAVRHLSWLVFVVGCYTSPPPTEPGPLVLHPAGGGPVEQGDAEPEEALAAGGSQQADGDRPTVTLAGGTELVLLGTDRATLDAARVHAFDRVCVQDRARIDVDGSTRIELTSDRPTVIGGSGIGPRGTSRARIEITARGAPDVFVLFDNARAPIDAVFDAPNSTVHAAITGKTGLTIGGRTKSMVSHAGWGLPPAFPTCDASSDRDPEPSYPPSKSQPANCVGTYTSSNYVTPQPGRDELHIIGVYEGSKHVDGIVDVHVPARRRRVTLVLSAYQPTVWRVHAKARIAEILVYGYEAQRIEGVAAGTRVKQIAKPDFVCAYGWEPAANDGGCYYKKMVAAVRKATGLVETSFQGCYAGRTFEVP